MIPGKDGRARLRPTHQGSGISTDLVADGLELGTVLGDDLIKGSHEGRNLVGGGSGRGGRGRHRRGDDGNTSHLVLKRRHARNELVEKLAKRRHSETTRTEKFLAPKEFQRLCDPTFCKRLA